MPSPTHTVRVLAALCAAGLLAATLPRAITGAGRPDGWNDATHSRNADPDYARVFAGSRVNRIDITVTSDDWSRVIADMTDMTGTFGAQRQPGVAGGFGGFPQPSPDAIAACSGSIEGDSCTLAGVTNGRCSQQPAAPLACVGFARGGTQPGQPGVPPGVPPDVPPGVQPGVRPGGGLGAGGANDDVELFPRTPIYVPVSVSFDAVRFTRVGFRLKGNSSLSGAWRAGSEKLPFRLNMDAFENDYPEIRDQTFFGFPNLAFTNNGTDTSFLRQRVVTDLFREAGVPAAHTAFVRVFLDRGTGPLYLGLYTMAEVPDSPMLTDVFGSDGGNLYKPSGTGGRWTRFIAGSFPKRTNEADEDWTDIEDAIAALNASRSSAAPWRSSLEARFNVNGFLRWLALNTIVANTDAYGGLSAHNYYLYGSPRHRDRLFWIAWDHDLAMGSMGGGNPGTGTTASAVDIMRDTAQGQQWPLIRFLMDDPVYRDAYRRHAEDLLATVFEPARLVTRLRAEQALITPYVVGPEGEQSGRTFLQTPAQFATSVDQLVTYVQARATAVRQALGASR
ncbi:MAG: CotH kinase family protein [Vicinamibacterales bacterium]|nr:CotH kinase family protein [Vicinamibacterales bacterium]